MTTRIKFSRAVSWMPDKVAGILSATDQRRTSQRLALLPLFIIVMCGISRAETVTYYYTNQQGTPLATADSAGNILSTVDYRPYGMQALGSAQAGPGYTGHVSDLASGLVYMQARYYDPVVARFLSVDPKGPAAGNLFSTARYSYANNSPGLLFDPDGRAAQLYWYANDKATYVVLYHIDNSRAQSPVSNAMIEKAVHDAFSKTVSLNGTSVTVDAEALQSDGSGKWGAENLVKVVPTTDGVTQSGRAETSGPNGGIGGNVITVGAGGKNAATARTFGHELGGHAGGAADLYAGGIGLDGKKLQKDAPGAQGIMFNGQNGASDDSVRQILMSPTTSNICSPGVHAANGGC